jgi:hypothetical protein
MHMLRPRAILAIFFSLLLIAAQQAAIAHMIGHVGQMLERAEHSAKQADASTQQDDKYHGETPNLSHCATCVSVAGLAFATLPATLPSLACARAAVLPIPVSCTVSVTATPQHYLARAPPAVL